ncbi:MAG: tetratricopeptide repeat protein [Candidatus Obscuribacterales bacterium]|nr:tetratricopeptide repeat protein [Candidatus Obscuribacterales bacterium]
MIYSKRAQSFDSAPLSVLLALSLSFAFSALEARASSDLMSGMSAYQAKDYRAARTYFQRAVQSAPEDSLAHYYLGNTLLKLKDPSGAKKEYQAGSANAETDDVKTNCDKAIESLQKNDKTQTVKAGPAIGAAAATAVATPTGKDATANPSTPAKTLPGSGTVQGSPGAEAIPEVPLTPLQKHANMEKELLKQQTEAAQKQLLENAAMHAKSIEADTKRATDTSDMNARYRARAQAYLNEIKAQGDKQRAQALDYGKTRAADARKMQEEKARSIDEVVNNLNDQMNSKVGNSSVHLKPEGTSIYIRNYGP